MKGITSSGDLAVLQVLRVRGASSADDLDRALGEDAAARLTTLADAGSVSRDSSNRWHLTERGRVEHEDASAAARPRVIGVVQPVLERFLPYDEKVKRLCTLWQETDPGDSARRWDILGDLDDIACAIAPALDCMADRLPRFPAYACRLHHAIDRARDGDARYVASPLVDSFHSVWFEFHEDLLISLGLRR